MIDGAIARVEAAIAAASARDPGAGPLLAAAVAPALGAARGWPAWPAAALPRAVAQGVGLPATVADGLAAATILFFAAADVIDDAQDGDLPATPFGGWPAGVATGLALVFMCQRAAVEAAPAAAAAVAAAIADAGLAMSLGQRQDLALRAPLGVGGEAAQLACARAKTGASLALFAALPAVAAGAPVAEVAALRAWGEATGARLQLASDLADALAPSGRDRAAGRPTLPVHRAWARLDPADRPLLEAAWRGEPEAAPMGFWLERTGAIAATRARLAALRIEADDALAAARPAVAEALAAWADAYEGAAGRPLL